jgi:hypothetical protein
MRRIRRPGIRLLLLKILLLLLKLLLRQVGGVGTTSAATDAAELEVTGVGAGAGAGAGAGVGMVGVLRNSGPAYPSLDGVVAG